MTLVISATTVDGYVLVEAAGRIFGIDDYKLLTNRAFEKMTAAGSKRVVIDGTRIKWIQSVQLQADIIAFYAAELPEEARSWKMAQLADQRVMGLMKFWEFNANRIGLDFRVFSSKQEAIGWITAPPWGE